MPHDDPEVMDILEELKKALAENLRLKQLFEDVIRATEQRKEQSS